MDASTAKYCYNSEVMGYHVYQDIWKPTTGEILACFRETENDFDTFAVCIKRDTVIVGHVPSKISGNCLYLNSSNSCLKQW